MNSSNVSSTEFETSAESGFAEPAADREMLPEYAGELDAFHRAFEPELREMILSLPLKADARVADVGCGDGFYVSLLAERLGEAATVIGIDSNAAYLAVARRRLRNVPSRCRVEFRLEEIANLDRLPATFNLVWCAQSLMSFPDPVGTLRTLAGMLCPGGMLAVLENDTLHQLLLPWPSSLELAIRVAEFQELMRQPEPGKYYIGRRLSSVLADAGLTPVSCRTIAVDRSTPIDGELALFVESYLRRLEQRITPHLSDLIRAEFLRLIDPASDDYLLSRPYFTLTWLNILALARNPS